MRMFIEVMREVPLLVSMPLVFLLFQILQPWKNQLHHEKGCTDEDDISNECGQYDS